MGIETENEDGETVVEYGRLTQLEVNSLDTPFFRASMTLYSDFKVFGCLPHGHGTLAERQTVLDIIKVLSNEEARYENWRMEKSMNERKR